MHLKAKKIAFSGVMLAICVVCMILGSVIETNTLALLALASFSVGIIVCEYGIGLGVGYYAAAVVLGLLLAPNKFYCLTFAAMGFYILTDEIAWQILSKISSRTKYIIWPVKWVIFNAMYLPIIWLLPDIIFSDRAGTKACVIASLLGQLLWLVYDRVYDYFQRAVWNKYRKYIQ